MIAGNFRGFKILWIDQNKDVNHIIFLIFLHNFLQTMKSTKFNSHKNFQLYGMQESEKTSTQWCD